MKLNIRLFILTTLILFTNISYSQWVSVFNGRGPGIDGSSSSDIGTAVTANNTGNCYVTGYSTAFSGNYDFLTIKYNSNGDTLWCAVYNGESNNDDKAFGIAVDQYDNVFITGYSYSSESGYDYLTIKYNSSGVQQWAARYNGTGNDEDKAFGIVVDAEGDVYVSGRSKGSNTNFDCVTIKYNSEGSIQWVDRYDAAEGDDENVAISKDVHGYIYTTGFSMNSSGDYDYITMKFDGSGNRTWLSRYAGNGNSQDKAFGIAVDDEDNILITGTGTTNANNDYLTVKYNSEGSLQWTADYNGPVNSSDKAFGIAVDHAGNVYVTGESTGDNSDYDYLTIKYNSSGSQQWEQRYNGTGNSIDLANALILTGSSVVVTGTSRSSMNLGSEDMVTVKYNKETGDQEQLNRYDGGPAYSDAALGIATDSLQDIFITGYSMMEFGDNFSHSSLVTLKYKGKNNLIINANSNNSPSSYNLGQNYPNPFNPTTTISFNIVKSGIVKLTVYDILGKEVKVLVNQNMQAGNYDINFNLSNLASGVYFYELKSGTFRDVKKLTLVK